MDIPPPKNISRIEGGWKIRVKMRVCVKEVNLCPLVKKEVDGWLEVVGGRDQRGRSYQNWVWSTSSSQEAGLAGKSG